MNQNLNNVGIYVHIPFCPSKCGYCDFYSIPGADESLMEGYTKAVLAHIGEAAQFTGKNAKTFGRAADTVYFGGGTPAFLGIVRLKKLLAGLRKGYHISKGAEITIEANPDTVTLRTLKKLRKAGFNRISFGIQATQPDLLDTLGRAHDTQSSADAVRNAAAAGFDNISADIMYGIPGQKWADLEETLHTVFTWGVRHISLYGLKLEEGTPLYEKNPIFPSDEEQAECYLNAIGLLEGNGFLQYEISNFAQQGFACRHNSKYWDLGPYMGFGASAHSDLGNRRYAYVKDIQEYINGVNDSNSIMQEMHEIKMVERAGEYVMLGLRTTKGISSNEYTRLFNVSFDSLEVKLERCAKWKLCTRSGDRWRLTPQGFLVSNQIIGELLNPMASETAVPGD
ncbi:MAG: radical SAM family heme chaperone HemW [Oscillospiraceae bacterium]|nr:radical SAM family heme chaperone HemW [Oscillospiraceae bacterium]